MGGFRGSRAFCLSVPLAKALLGEVATLPLAGLLYLGAGLATGIALVLSRKRAMALT